MSPAMPVISRGQLFFKIRARSLGENGLDLIMLVLGHIGRSKKKKKKKGGGKDNTD